VHHPLVHYQAAAADRGAGQLTAVLGILRTPTRARNLPAFATAWQNRAHKGHHTGAVTWHSGKKATPHSAGARTRRCVDSQIYTHRRRPRCSKTFEVEQDL